MITKTCDTYWVKIFIAGPIEVAKQVLRMRGARQGMCVTIEPTTYIYSGGEEAGYVVGLINYPRFPKEPWEIDEEATSIADELLEATGQHSYSIMNPTDTIWKTKREQ